MMKPKTAVVLIALVILALIGKYLPVEKEPCKTTDVGCNLSDIIDSTLEEGLGKK